MTVLSLLVLALVGCGGDDDSGDDRASGRTGSETRTKTPPRTGETTPGPSRSGTQRKRQDESGRTEAARPGRQGGGKKARRSKEPYRDDTGRVERKKTGNPHSRPARGPQPSKPYRPGSSSGDKTVVRQPLTGRALKRCLQRTVRRRGERRLRAQARCLGTTARELRRLIVANCRRATKNEAAARRCIRIGTVD